MSDELDRDVAEGERFERRLFWRSPLILVVIAGVITARALWG